MSPPTTEGAVAFDVAALLAWYAENRRMMPWRAEVSPYRTLVSELMLQQTRVETVIPYFERFLRDFPTVEALAAAPLERVLERWAGLGYYSRARNLHAAAQAVAAAGGFPTTVDGLRALPGVGPYTAGAVASIALGVDAPLVDGNVERVLCRQLAWAVDPKRHGRRLWEEAARLLPSGRAGDFNQALMEIGATTCIPRNPRCGECPIAGACLGRATPERYPAPKEKAPVPERRAVAALVRVAGGVLMARRPDEGLLGGLWEPPAGPGHDVAAVLGARLDVGLADVVPRGEVVHVFSHLRLVTTVYEARTADAPRLVATSPDRAFPPYAELRVVPEAAIGDLALSTLARKWLAAARSSTGRPSAGRSGGG